MNLLAKAEKKAKISRLEWSQVHSIDVSPRAHVTLLEYRSDS